MHNLTIFPVISIISIFLLGFSTFNLFRRRSIIEILLGVSVWTFIILEIAKFSLVFELNFAQRILGLGFCLLSIFWLITSISFLPQRLYTFSRVLVSPLFAFLSLIFFFLWWIKPFFTLTDTSGVIQLSKLARYFFVVEVFSLSIALSNFERSFYYLKTKYMRLLLITAAAFLLPYIFLAIYAVIFGYIAPKILFSTSLTTLAGGFLFLFLSQKETVAYPLKEETAIHTSLVLFLLGGYLFFIGIFVKLFQLFGWNLKTLFSFLTAIFLFLAFLFLILSSSVKERIKIFLLKSLSREKYDWQKIWEEFTYKISLTTEWGKLKDTIEQAISKILGARFVKIFLFDENFSFEEEFSDWFIRYAEPLTLLEFVEKGFGHKYSRVYKFFKENDIDLIAPLYGDKRIIGVIGISAEKELTFLEKELLKLLSLQSSSVILSSRHHQKLKETEKKESIYKISSFIIHDVKNYVSNLKLLIANKDKFENPQFRKDAIFSLETTVGRMLALIEEFKTLRGELVMKKKEVSLYEIINEVLTQLKERLKKFEVIFDVDKSIQIEVDPYYFHKVIFNLIVKALEAMKDEGTLTIKAELSGKEKVILSIQDTGCGMSGDFLENKLFKPFASTKKKGLGIGLYQSKMIIENLGGTISAESKENEGTIFRIILPVCAQMRVDERSQWSIVNGQRSRVDGQ